MKTSILEENQRNNQRPKIFFKRNFSFKAKKIIRIFSVFRIVRNFLTLSCKATPTHFIKKYVKTF